MVFAKHQLDSRNFLFFLNEAHPASIEDPLIGALAVPSSWGAVTGMINKARRKDTFVRSIGKACLYVHVPFCGRLCTFCHCRRVLLQRRLDIDDYIKALTSQMMFFAPVLKGMDTSSICFGGGTPSILDEEQMTAVLDAADKAFPSAERKILFEVHPASWTASKLAVLLSRGLSRISIGVESLDEKVLKAVSRSQTRKKVLWCLRSARKAGVPHINVDLMAGLPGQTLKGLKGDLKTLIAEGASIVHVHPYCSASLKQLCAPGESVQDFLNRRDAMMKEAASILDNAGFSRKGFGAYTRHGEGEDYQEEVCSRFEAALAGFGPFAIGQFPGAVYYHSGASTSMADLTVVNAVAQDAGYVMSSFAVNALINGLDERVFLKRFGIPLEQHCGEGLRYLQEAGLLNVSQGVWKFHGKWEVRRLRELIALSRCLYGEGLLTRLRASFHKTYDPNKDYSRGDSLLKAYANNLLMSLYYRMGV